jgi:hypothetical protein
MKDKLLLISPNSRTLDDPVELESLGGGRFRYTAKGGGGAIGEVVWFTEENGKPTRLYVGDGYFVRVDSVGAATSSR